MALAFPGNIANASLICSSGFIAIRPILAPVLGSPWFAVPLSAWAAVLGSNPPSIKEAVFGSNCQGSAKFHTSPNEQAINHPGGGRSERRVPFQPWFQEGGNARRAQVVRGC